MSSDLQNQSVLRLYGGAISRASIVQWYLEELNVPYQFVLLDMASEQHRNPNYLAINPFGRLPAIVDGDFKLWESGAILLYIANKYSKEINTPKEWAEASQWILFANATLAPSIFNEAIREKEVPLLLNALSEQLVKQPFLKGNQLTVADVAVCPNLWYFMSETMRKAYPVISEYINRVTERPTFKKAIVNRQIDHPIHISSDRSISVSE